MWDACSLYCLATFTLAIQSSVHVKYADLTKAVFPQVQSYLGIHATGILAVPLFVIVNASEFSNLRDLLLERIALGMKLVNYSQ